MLRTVLFTFAAANAFRRNRLILTQRRAHEICHHASEPAVRVASIVRLKARWDIYPLRTRHAVATAGTADLNALVDRRLHPLENLQIRLRHLICLCL